MNNECSSTSIQTEERVRISEQTLARQLEWIRTVDTKVSILVGIDIAMLGVLATAMPASSDPWWYAATLAIVGGCCTVTSLTFCALATFPRVSSPNRSLLFFGSISTHSVEEYIKCFTTRSLQDHLEDLLYQAHRNAQIACVKYGMVKWASAFLIGGAIPWLIVLYTLGSG